MKHKLLNKLLVLTLLTWGGVVINPAWAETKTLVYIVASKTAVTLQDESTGSFSGSVTFQNTGTNNNDQMTNGNTMTLTLSNFPYKVAGVTLRLKRNSSKGGGTVSINHNNTSIGGGTKNKGDLTSSYTNYDFICTDTNTSGDLVVLLTSTENSFWCTKFTITYEESASTVCATPTFSPAAGAVAYNTSVAISCATDEATIYYTTNGDTPTTSSSVYSSPIAITSAQTIKAIAVKDGLTNSEVGSAAYTIKTPDAPTFSPDEGMVIQGTSLTLSSEAGTTIRYTTDETTPTNSVGTLYTSPITINSTQTIKAVAYDGGGNTSSVVSKTYTVFVGDIVTFDATSDTGTSLSKNKVSFTTSATESSVFKFYKNSTTTFTATDGKIKRIEFTGVTGYAISNMTASTGTLNTSDSPNGVWTGNVTSVTFTASTAQARATLIKVYVAKTAAPTFSVSEGEYSSAQSVTISCATDGAAIYYTTDGSTPTSSSTAYSSPILVTETMTLKAIAINDGIESAVTSATYTMNRPAAPTFDVAGGVFDEAFDLHLTATDGATIYYTTDGTTPTTGSSVYSTKVAISAATTMVKAIAVKNGLTSDVSSATYTYDARTTPTFTLSSKAVDLKVNVEGSVTLTTNHDGTITATSSDGTHMPVSYNTSTKVCTFTANQAGDYTITFSATGGTLYKDAEDVVTVSVTKKASTIVLTPSFSSKDIHVTTSGSLTGVAQYNSSNIAGATVTYSSSDETVATINASGAVTFLKAGSTTLTASYAGDDEYEESEATYVLDLIDTTPQETEVEITLNNTFFGCTAFTQWSSSYEDSYSGVKDNVTVTYDKGSASAMYINSTGIRLYNDNTFSISAPTGYTIIEIALEGATGFDANLVAEGLENGTWKGEAPEVEITGNTNKNNMTKATVTLAETAAIGTAGYTTYVAKHDISFPDGVTAYIATTKTAETLRLTEKASVPEGTAIILKGGAGTYAMPTIKTSPDDVKGNLLLASDGSVTGGSGIYALSLKNSVVGFYPVSSEVTIPAGKAYLNLGGGSVKGFTFEFEEDDADGIAEIENGKLKVENEGAVYNLSGQRINKMQKGINIVNGKKVLY